MPKVTLGRFTEKDKRFIRNVKSGLVKKGMCATELAKKIGTSSKTVYKRYGEPEKMTVKELRGYIRVTGIPKEEILDFLCED